jgi:dihydrofolate synthase/folylpolyglutamate synthase
MMDYPAAVAHLLSLGLELKAGKFGLENITRLAAALGHPERSAPAVLIAGTNGKGSTAAMTEAVLRTAGYRTGLYTSPHLVRINERVRVDGEEIGDGEFAACCNRVHQAVERLLANGELEKHPSFFESLTALAFLHFQESACQIAVLEVGMGGRLDATNIVRPLISVITPVDFDHEQYLGNTIEQIAGEKAGIIRPGGRVVMSAQRPEAEQVIARVAAERGARLVRAETFLTQAAGYELSLAGEHQIANAAGVLAVIEELRAGGWQIPEFAVRQGLRDTVWPGRLESIGRRPAVYLDGAHNPAGARVLRVFLEGTPRPRVLIFGAMRDKAVEEIAGILFPAVDAVVLTRPSHKRAASVETLREVTAHLCVRLEVEAQPDLALERGVDLAGTEGTVVAAGSLYLVGDLKAVKAIC